MTLRGAEKRRGKKKRKTTLLAFQISDSVYTFPAKLERKQTQGSMTEKNA